MTDAATPTSDQPAARVPGGPTGARGPAVSPPPSPRQAAAAYLQPHVTAFLDAQGVIDHPALVLERPARPEHGDLALNLALRLAKPLGRRPLDIANDLAAAIPAGGPIAAVAVAPPGFLNLRLDLAWLFGTMREVVAAGPHWGRLDFGAGQKVQVEFVSANPTGPLLFSHGRGAVVGDTVARLLDFTGHAVEREFYVNDAGRQVKVFGMSLVAARLGRPAPDDGYSGEYIQELAAAIPDEVWGGEPERLTRVTDWGIQHYLAEYRQHLGDIGIGFDHWFSERDLYGEWSEATRAVLAAKGAITEHDGATWITLPDGQEEVLVKSTGDGTYFWGDILYHRDKLVRRGFDRAIDVWGADHQNQVRRVKDVLSLFGVDPERFQVVLIQLVHMRTAGGFVKISKRLGNLILLRDLVEEVGADAVRYHYLLRSAEATMDFDLDLAREQSNENPVFYAQYAHARLCSLKAVAAEAGILPDPAGLARLGAPGEVELARELLELPDVVELAASEMAPHHLPHYAQRLAEKVHAFYHAGHRDPGLRVVVADDRELSGARLFLCEAARVTMSNLLGLMGVAAPVRM